MVGRWLSSLLSVVWTSWVAGVCQSLVVPFYSVVAAVACCTVSGLAVGLLTQHHPPGVSLMSGLRATLALVALSCAMRLDAVFCSLFPASACNDSWAAARPDCVDGFVAASEQ